MGTLVCFHAHPDDESIATGGTMALAAAGGHRVVLVLATRGEHGEIVPDVLAEGEQLGLRRLAETHASASELGAVRVELLGYVDSGMIGTPENEVPFSFWQADVEHAARRLAVILDEEQADVLTVYDDNGGYGHPDHIQVHRVGRRAAELAGVAHVFESTINRDHFLRGMAQMADAAGEAGLDTSELPDITDDTSFGVTEDRITHVVDVAAHLGAKRRSMRAHRSQISDDAFFLAMPEEAFAYAFGQEWYIADGPEPPAGSLAAELFTPYTA
ncbi:PIG-L family deacetylase [soil metagenome]